MGMRHAAVVAGLALGLMSETAMAATVTFDINYIQGSMALGTLGRVTGTIAGDVASNGLVQSFSDYNLTLSAQQGSNTSSINIDGNGPSNFFNAGSLIDNVGILTFTFDGSGSGFDISNTSRTGFLNIFAGDSFGGVPSTLISTPAAQSRGLVTLGQTIVLGTVSTVPLPASAPLFGAALVALGGLGYAAKRKKAAAAV